MKHGITALALAAFLAWAAPAWAILECADYISGSINGKPAAGHLIGEQLVTEEWDVGFNGGAKGGLRGTVQYRVGIYKMNDGRRIKVDCRDYTMA